MGHNTKLILGKALDKFLQVRIRNEKLIIQKIDTELGKFLEDKKFDKYASIYIEEYKDDFLQIVQSTNEVQEKFADKIIETVNTHLPILYTKYKQNVVKNEYGIIEFNNWFKEVTYFMDKVLLPNIVNEELVKKLQQTNDELWQIGDRIFDSIELLCLRVLNDYFTQEEKNILDIVLSGEVKNYAQLNKDIFIKDAKRWIDAMVRGIAHTITIDIMKTIHVQKAGFEYITFNKHLLCTIDNRCAKKYKLDYIKNSGIISTEKSSIIDMLTEIENPDYLYIKLSSVQQVFGHSAERFYNEVLFPVFVWLDYHNLSSDMKPYVQTPVEYEQNIATQLIKMGFGAHTTVATGDQGADIVANKNGVSFAIQCKMYAKPVGNKAVQEANAARSFYGADYGCVVTNSGFTKSAQQLANTCNVLLLHDSQLAKLLNYT